MKIAFISQGFGRIDLPVINGSISIWTYEILCQLKQTETVIAYEMEGGSAFSRIKHYENATYIYAPSFSNKLINRISQKIFRFKNKLRFTEGSNKKPIFASIFYNIGYILWVAINLRSQNCDLVHIHQFSQYVPVIRLFNRDIKIVLHMHSEWLNQLEKQIIRKRIAKSDLIVGCSDYISQKIEQAFPAFKHKVVTVYNGVHHLQFKPETKRMSANRKGNPHLLFVGRVSPEKGIHVLIRAVRQLVEQYPSIQLDIVGGIASAPKEFIVDLSDDPKVKDLAEFYPTPGSNGQNYYDCLKNMCKGSLESHVNFTGRVPYQEIIEYYREMDILINPSLSESFGMSLVEAMSAEKPVVATRVGGMVNVVDNGKTGIIVEPDDEIDLAQAISYLIENPELREKMGKAGRERIMEKFSWEAVARSLLSEYRKLF